MSCFVSHNGNRARLFSSCRSMCCNENLCNDNPISRTSITSKLQSMAPKVIKDPLGRYRLIIFVYAMLFDSGTDKGHRRSSSQAAICAPHAVVASHCFFQCRKATNSNFCFLDLFARIRTQCLTELIHWLTK